MGSWAAVFCWEGSEHSAEAGIDGSHTAYNDGVMDPEPVAVLPMVIGVYDR